MACDTTPDYIAHLRSLHARWTSELQEIQSVNPERARHLVDALEDLEHLTARLERRQARITRALATEAKLAG